MRIDPAEKAASLVRMLIEQRRELIDHMQKDGQFEDLQKLKVVQEAIEAAERAHFAERESNKKFQFLDLSRNSAQIMDPFLSIGYALYS